MKSFVFAAVTLALATSSASGAKCVLTELVTELDPITKMVYACYDATGYAVIPPRANPTAEQTAAVCAKCPEMIAMAKTMTFNSCTFAVGGVDIPLNEWVPKITGACAATSTASAGSTTGSSSNASTTVGATANSTTTSAPAAAASTTSGSGSTGASSTVTTPSPAPTTSAGVTASLSVAAVAVGSIAAFIL